jgi:CheY-like chemotaxis protein
LEQPAALEAILEELHVLRHMQGEILMLLRPRAEAEPAEGPGAGDEHPAIVPPVRSRRRKTVLVIDDDPETRAATVAALQQAEVPMRAVEGGREGLEAIASEKPDVIVLELEVGGDLGGRDVINMLKATMDWLDIPIVLYTRSPVESQKEARTIHGADELVSKAAGPEALVPRIIALFRRG